MDEVLGMIVIGELVVGCIKVGLTGTLSELDFFKLTFELDANVRLFRLLFDVLGDVIRYLERCG